MVFNIEILKSKCKSFNTDLYEMGRKIQTPVFCLPLGVCVCVCLTLITHQFTAHMIHLSKFFFL